jgi:hypothetical protein
VCSYCQGSGEETPISFRRRAYWLINDTRYILVHYLDEAHIDKSESRMEIDSILFGSDSDL